MIWLVVFGLAVWCVSQQLQIREFGRDIEALRDALLRRDGKDPEPQPKDERAFTLFERAEAAPPAPVEPPAPQSVDIGPTPNSAGPDSAPSPAMAPTFETWAPPTRPRPMVSEWLSEKGLAWIGGGALALGGLMMVAYAAQKGLFTPAFRIIAAIVIGGAAIAVGEVLRRAAGARSEAPSLVAALTTAAGAAIIYAAIWASHILYHFIPLPLTAALLAAVSLALLALALRFSEALGILAILGALAVPIVSGGGAWDGGPLDAYLILIAATGIAASGLRAWPRVGEATIVAIGLWAVARVLAQDPHGVAALAVALPVLALIATRMNRRRQEPDAADTLRLIIFSATGSAFFAGVLWTGLAGGLAAVESALTLITLMVVLATGIRLGLVGAWVTLLPAASVIIIAALGALAGFRSLGGLRPDRLAWFLVALATLPVAGLAAGLSGPDRRRAAMIGAGAAALALTMLVRPLAAEWPQMAVAVDLGFAAMFALGAVILARTSAEPTIDLSLAAWVAASAEAVGLAVHSGVDGRLAPAAYGLLGMALAALALRLRWRGFAEAATAACLAGFAALFGPAVAGAALTGRASALMVAGVAGAAAATQGVVWRILKRRGNVSAAAEAASTLATLSAVLGAFLVVQRLDTPAGSAIVLGSFVSTSVRTVLLLAAGLVLALRGGTTPIGRWRAPVFLAVGAAHGLLLEGAWLNPWWGWRADAVLGPPVIDSLMLGLLGPGVLLTLAAQSMVRASRGFGAAAVATGLAFLALWMVTEVRRLFHGPALQFGEFSYAEVAAYATGLLLLACGLGVVRHRLVGLLRNEDTVSHALAVFDGAALVWGVITLGYWASPWWGPLDGPLRSPILFFGLMGLVIGASGWITRQARLSDRPALARAGLTIAAVDGFTLITLLVRYAFHSAAMRAPLREASLETWSFSAVWALFGLVMLAAGAARRDLSLRGLGLTILLLTTAKVFLFDMATLEGVVRAASFLALGAMLLFGAFIARRLGMGSPSHAPDP